MLDRLLKKTSYLVGMLPIAAVFGLLAWGATIEIKDLDLWLHIATGRFILEHWQIPYFDILSCSIAGQPWIDHEWLFQVIVAAIFDHWGTEGLLTMQMSIAVGSMLLLLFLGYDKDKQLGVAFVLLLVYFVFQQRFTIRPDLFSLFFFAIYIFVLSLHIDKRWSVPLLGFVQILWVNSHGFFFFGPLFVCIGISSEFLRRRVRLPYEWNKIGKLTDQEYQRLKFLLVVAILACFVNPYTIEGALYPVTVFFSLGAENKIFFQHIEELQKPILWGNILEGEESGKYKLLILISGLSLVFNRRKIDISALFLWVAFLFFSLGAIRNVIFFAFAAYLVYITNTLHFSWKDIVPLRFVANKFHYLTSIFVKLLFLVAILQFGGTLSGLGYYDFEKYEMKSEFGGISLRSVPHKAVNFLVENNIQGNFFNDFNSGAYLLGRCYPKIKVFIDGRTEVYGAKFFREYQRIWEEGDGEFFDQKVEQYQLTGALLNSVRQHTPQGILKYLYEHPAWIPVYFDYDAMIFLKDIPQNQKWIQEFAIDLRDWTPKTIDLLRLGSAGPRPYHNYYRAYALESLGLADQAMGEAEEALRAAPWYGEVHDLLGKIYADRKEFEKAFEHFRIAVTQMPDSKETRFNLALAYVDLGEYDGAIQQYKEITQIWPNDPKGYYFLAQVHAKKGESEQAFEVVRQAYQKDPFALSDLMIIGDVLYEGAAYATAAQVYELVLRSDPQFDLVKEKLQLTLNAVNSRL